MQFTTQSSANLPADLQKHMFDMYVTSYTMGGQPLWFNTPEEMLARYPILVIPENQSVSDNITVFGLAQPKKLYTKLSLVCHDGSDQAKQQSIDLRVTLLKCNGAAGAKTRAALPPACGINTVGWICEASDKVGWILRKQKVPIITSKERICLALDVDPSTVTMNDQFDATDKHSHQYVRHYTASGENATTYESKEILFGRTHNVAVVGSRTFSDFQKLADTLDEYAYTFGCIHCIVSGGAKGADTLAEQYAQQHGLPILTYLPDWNQYGRAAGPIRNQQIVNASDAVIAFWDGKSKGTMSTISYAKKTGKPVMIVRYEE